MIRKTIILAAPLALLAACSGSQPEAPANDVNAVDEGVIVPNALDAPLVNAEPIPEPSATPTPEAAPEPVPADEQVRDDADATGMTARVSREESQPAEEKAAPAEDRAAEEK